MLNYEEFQLELMKALEERYPTAKIVRQSRFKFNGIKQGIVIEMSGNIQPIVYPDNLYEGYLKVEDMGLVLDSVELAIECEKMNRFKNMIKDWEQAKEHLYPYIVNLEKNQLCMDCNDYVYKEKLDFAYGVFWELADDDGIACVNITKQMLDMWNVSEEEVFAVAEKNAKYVVKPIKQIIDELLGEEVSEEEISESEAMYVLTNTTRNRAAAGIFDMDLMKKTAEELESDFFILPSSIHDAILVLEKFAPSEESLRKMVKEVNQTQVKEEEYLSENVYLYSREKKTVDIVEFD